MYDRVVSYFMYKSSFLLLRWNILNSQSRWEGLTKLLSLVAGLHDESVQVAVASNLELGLAGFIDLDGDGLGVLTASLQEKVLDFADLFRHLVLFPSNFCKFDLRL